MNSEIDLKLKNTLMAESIFTFENI